MYTSSPMWCLLNDSSLKRNRNLATFTRMQYAIRIYTTMAFNFLMLYSLSIASNDSVRFLSVMLASIGIIIDSKSSSTNLSFLFNCLHRFFYSIFTFVVELKSHGIGEQKKNTPLIQA